MGMLILFLGNAGVAYAQSTSKKADLKETNTAESKTVKSIPENTKLAIIQRLGFWVQVKADNASGWLRLSEVQFSDGSNNRVNLSNIESGRTGKNNIVSASAARGLSASQLQEAPADFTALQLLKSLSANDDVLLKFRKEGSLQVKTFSPLIFTNTVSAKLDQGDTGQKSSTATNSKAKAKNEDW